MFIFVYLVYIVLFDVVWGYGVFGSIEIYRLWNVDCGGGFNYIVLVSGEGFLKMWLFVGELVMFLLRNFSIFSGFLSCIWEEFYFWFVGVVWSELVCFYIFLVRIYFFLIYDYFWFFLYCYCIFCVNYIFLKKDRMKMKDIFFIKV